jgi:hypothetical protein
LKTSGLKELEELKPPPRKPPNKFPNVKTRIDGSLEKEEPQKNTGFYGQSKLASISRPL